MGIILACQSTLNSNTEMSEMYALSNISQIQRLGESISK